MVAATAVIPQRNPRSQQQNRIFERHNIDAARMDLLEDTTKVLPNANGRRPNPAVSRDLSTSYDDEVLHIRPRE